MHMVNFKRFADYELGLDPGFTLVVGPNESGKSTIVEAIAVALFADPASKSRLLRELERWGSQGAMRLELEFEHAGRRYQLVKDFGAGRVELRDSADQTVVGDRREVDRRIREMIGFGSRDAFESVAAVRQGELTALVEHGRRGKLVPMIERKMTSSSAVIDAASVLGRLDEEIREMRRGLDHAHKRPGPLKRNADERARLSRRIEEVRAAWASVVRAMNELAAERDQLEVAQSAYERLDRAVRNEERRRETAEKLEHVRAALREREQRIARIRRLRKDIEDAWARIGETSYVQQKREIAQAKSDLAAAERRMQELVAAAPGWAVEGADKRAAVATGAVWLVALFLLLSPAILALGRSRMPLVAAGAVAAVVAALLSRRALRVGAFARDLRVVRLERQKLATVLAAALSKLGFPSYVEFEHAIEAYDRAQRDVEKKRAVLAEICGTDEPEAYQRELETEATGLSRQERELQETLEAVGGADAGMTSGELAKLRAERELKAEELDRLKNSIARHEGEIGRAEAEESMPDLMARLEALEAERESLERRLRVLMLARDGLETALAETKEEAASALEPIVEQVLSRVTVERYADVDVGRDLGVWVANPDGSVGRPVLAPDDLSVGTVDQLYLAIRFALLEFLSPADGAPLILDDALVNADPRRRAAALSLLREIAAERQVLMFSCEVHGADLADAVITLPAV